LAFAISTFINQQHAFRRAIMLNRKGQMFVFVFAGLFALGCAGQDGDKVSPSERYENAVNEAATASDAVKNEGIVMSPNDMVALVAPINEAAMDQLAQVPRADAPQEEIAGFGQDLEVVSANLGRHYDVLENLDIPVAFSREFAEAPMCTTQEECIDSAFGDQSQAHGEEYWGRAACKGACTAAGVAAAAACTALCATGVLCPAGVACAAAAAAAAAICNEACDEIENF
jgi:hypothetical protein